MRHRVRRQNVVMIQNKERSRKGADKNALAAARGALRESGKLIVNLDVNDLCDMLHLKDKGDDHNTILVDRVDDMLMKLER